MIEDMGDFGTGVTPPPPPGEGQPAAPKSRSKARGAAAGVGVALVVGAGGIAVATSGSPSAGTPGAAPTTSEGAPAPGQAHPGFGGRGMGGGVLGIGAGVLHGTFVTAKSGGGYQTVQVQTGTVDTVTSTAIAVTSKDGFKYTYVVKAGTNVDAQRDGITSVKKGDEVVVSAIVSGGTATVDRVTDTTDLRKNLPNAGTGERPNFGGGGASGGHRPQRSPGASPTTPATGT